MPSDFSNDDTLVAELPDFSSGNLAVPDFSEGNTPDPTTGEKTVNALGAIPRGAVDVAASIPESIAIAARELDRRVINLSGIPDEAPLSDRGLFQLGQWMRKETAEAFPKDPRLEDSFWAEQVPSGIGSTIGFLGTGLGLGAARNVAGRVLAKKAVETAAEKALQDAVLTTTGKGLEFVAKAAPIMASGAMVNAVQGYKDALAHNADEDTAIASFVANGVGGIAEAAPIQRILNRINRSTGGGVSKAIRDILSSGAEELIQESGQQALSNVIAQNLYDSEREALEGVAAAGGAGGVTGALLSALGIGGKRLLRGAQAPQADQFQDPVTGEWLSAEDYTARQQRAPETKIVTPFIPAVTPTQEEQDAAKIRIEQENSERERARIAAQLQKEREDRIVAATQLQGGAGDGRGDQLPPSGQGTPQSVAPITLTTVKLPEGVTLETLTVDQLRNIEDRLKSKLDAALTAEESGFPVIGGSASIVADIETVQGVLKSKPSVAPVVPSAIISRGRFRPAPTQQTMRPAFVQPIVEPPTVAQPATVETPTLDSLLPEGSVRGETLATGEYVTSRMPIGELESFSEKAKSLGWTLRSKVKYPDGTAAYTFKQIQPSTAARRGKVGDQLAEGEIVLTASGRETTAFPVLGFGSERKTQNTVKRVDKWLHENAVAEATARNDEFNLRQFQAENPAKMPQASKDAMEEYLFGEPAAPTPAEPSALKVGDEQTIMQVPSVLVDTKTIGGVRWDLFNGASLKEKRATVRVIDDSGEVLQLKQFPTYDAAESYYKSETEKAQKMEAPAKPPVEAKAKEPWEMLKSEWAEHERKGTWSDFSDAQLTEARASERAAYAAISEAEQKRKALGQIESIRKVMADRQGALERNQQRRDTDKAVEQARLDFSKSSRRVSNLQTHEGFVKRAIERGDIKSHPDYPDLAPKAPPVAAPAPAPKPVTPKQQIAIDAKEFDNLLWPFGFTRDATTEYTTGLGTDAIKAKVKQSADLKSARRKAFSELLAEGDPTNPADRAALLPRLKAHVDKVIAFDQNAESRPVGTLSVGDKFTIIGEPHEVIQVTADGDVMIRGRSPKRLRDEDSIQIDPGSYVEVDQSGDDFPPPEPAPMKLDQPESVADQKARLAREEAGRKAKEAREKLAEGAAKPLIGKTGDIGQGDLLDGGDLFSQKTPSKPTGVLADLEASMTPEERAELAALEAELKKKLGQFNIGVDPTLVTTGGRIAFLYAKAGVRQFRDFANRMLAKFGEAGRQYLMTWYNNARMQAGGEGWDNEAEAQRIYDTEFAGRSEGGRAVPETVGGPGAKRSPIARVVRRELIPQPRSYVRTDSYAAKSGFTLGEEQTDGINQAVTHFLDRDGRAFVIADGTGFGKTAQLLGIIDQFKKARPSARILFITQNQQMIEGSITSDSRAMGIALGGISLTTYSKLKSLTTRDFDLVIFDEAHNLKNGEAQKSMAAARIRAAHKLFSTATPMDRPSGAAYFLAEIVGKDEVEVANELGYTFQQRIDPFTQEINTYAVLKPGFSWPKVWANIIAYRDAAIRGGAMLRREYPFYGQVNVQSLPMDRRAKMEQETIERHYDRLIDSASMPSARRNYSGQKTLTLRRWAEQQKVEEAFRQAMEHVNAGGQVIIMSETDKPQSFPVTVKDSSIGQNKQGREVWRSSGAIGQLTVLFENAGIELAHIHDTKKYNIADEVDKFQTGRSPVALATPKSGGAGINLDDAVGNKPRLLIILSKNLAGDLWDQVLGRVSRKTTQSEARVEVLTMPDAYGDQRADDILDKKIRTLRAIQGGEDLDTAAGFEAEQHAAPQQGASFAWNEIDTSTEPQIISRQEAEQTIARFRQAYPNVPDIILIENESELPASIRKAKPSEQFSAAAVVATQPNGERVIYILNSALTSVERLNTILAHEAIGHHGLESVMGEAFTELALSVEERFRGSQEWLSVADVYKKGEIPGPEDALTIGKELLARMSEGKIKNLSLWERVVAAVRNWWRTHVSRSNPISDAEIRKALVAARQFTERPIVEALTSPIATSFSAAEKLNELADELGTIRSQDEEGVFTKVGDFYDPVLSRRGLNDAVREDSVANAENALREAGLVIARHDDGLFGLVDSVTPQEESGQNLVTILEREIKAARADNRPERIANLLNTVVVHLARDNNKAFSQATKNRLYALAQGERSAFGRALGGLAMWGKVLANVARNPAIHLNQIYSDNFGGDDISEVLEKLRKILGAKPTAQEVEDALNKVQAEFSKKNRIFDKGGKLWGKIQKAVRDRLFDPGPILEDLARTNGMTVPTEEQKAWLREQVEKEERLRTPTQRDIDSAGGDMEKATELAAKGTESERLKIIKDIQAHWSRWSQPISWNPFKWTAQTRRNNAKAINEFVAANFLFTPGFPIRQWMDVMLTSLPLNAVNRTLVHAVERGSAQDLYAASEEMLVARIASLKATLRAMERATGGNLDRKVLERMTHSIGVFERMRVKANELKANGNIAGYWAIRLASILQAGYRVASVFDASQATGLEWQEMRQQLSTDLRAQGKDRGAIATQLNDILGGIHVDMAEAIAEVTAIKQERGLPLNKKTIEQDAWALIKARAYDRMRQATGTATDYQAENEQLRELHSWNLPETGGIGGAIAGTIDFIKRYTEKAGIPTAGLFSFGNAMGIAANRMATFSGGGLFGGFGFGDSPWYQGERNIRQRRIEAIEGLAVVGLLVALAAAGKILIMTRYPDDKDEKERFIAEGHKLNTIRFIQDDGRWLEYPIAMSPFSFIASPLYMIGGIQRLLINQQKAQERLNAEAAKTGAAPGQAKAIGPGDVLGVVAQGMYGMLTGGRTASGAIQSFSDYGDFNLNRASSSLVRGYIPGVPAWQTVARMMGVAIDSRTATLFEQLVPVPGSQHQRVNSLGDPMTNPNDAVRWLQVLTGGVGFGSDSAKGDYAYQQLAAAGYAAPAIGRSKGYNFGGTVRPLTPKEYERYTVERGKAFKQELESLGSLDGLDSADARKAAQGAFQRANQRALASVGISEMKPKRAYTRRLRSVGGITRRGRSSGGRIRRGRTPSFGKLRTARAPRLKRAVLTGTRKQRVQRIVPANY